ncbi:RbsD/FucU family protein [Listeria costaricensis]|uniref:RbsD/FucU family protein n=1 Tax=Listeria costaricensis TaxID=2026604 RepID=UPI000C070C85|nr:RbsD/FucU domain-containing protein [Listeria costaricensis]
MLKGIPAVLSPELLRALAEMGHGDELVIADGNYPCHTHGQQVIRADGLGTCDLLAAILVLLPLDTYTDGAAFTLMQPVPGDDAPGIWRRYREILADSTAENRTVDCLERFDFYERSRNSYLIVATSETALYANIILKKGVVELPREEKERLK